MYLTAAQVTKLYCLFKSVSRLVKDEFGTKSCFEIKLNRLEICT